MPPRTHQRRRPYAALVAATAALAGGCIPIAAQRLPQEVGAAIADNPMRRLETDDMLLYYPAGREVEAWRFLTRVEGCVDYLRRASQVHNGVADQKIVVILPELALNNAFVSPRFAGYETLAVVPTHYGGALTDIGWTLPDTRREATGTSCAAIA